MPTGRVFLSGSAAFFLASLALACSAGSSGSSDKTEIVTGGTGSGATSGSGNSIAGSAGASGAGTSGAGTAGASGSGTSGSAGSASGSGGAAGQAGTGQAGSGNTDNTGGFMGCDPSGMGAPFFDDFESGDLKCPEWLPSDPTISSLWSITTDGTSKVLTASSSAMDGPILASGDYSWTDMTVEAQVKFTGSPGMAMIFARVTDANNYYDLYLDGTNLIFRGKSNASGSGTSLSTGATNKIKTAGVGITQASGTWYTLKLKIAGKSVVGSLNGMDLINIADITTSDYVSSPSTYVASGGIGVGANGGVEFDNIKVTVP